MTFQSVVDFVILSGAVGFVIDRSVTLMLLWHLCSWSSSAREDSVTIGAW